MLSTVVLCAIKQIVIMVSVMAPFIWLEMFELVKTSEKKCSQNISKLCSHDVNNVA
jgi:hypothetical protein